LVISDGSVQLEKDRHKWPDVAVVQPVLPKWQVHLCVEEERCTGRWTMHEST